MFTTLFLRYPHLHSSSSRIAKDRIAGFCLSQDITSNGLVMRPDGSKYGVNPYIKPALCTAVSGTFSVCGHNGFFTINIVAYRSTPGTGQDYFDTSFLYDI
ncbi:MAG: hypothetical protein ACI4VX_07815 [Succinivibrionaceae bacterium]